MLAIKVVEAVAVAALCDALRATDADAGRAAFAAGAVAEADGILSFDIDDTTFERFALNGRAGGAALVRVNESSGGLSAADRAPEVAEKPALESAPNRTPVAA